MIIGIDASRALRPVRTGTEVYNAQIIKSLLQVDHKNTYRLYSHTEPVGDMLDLGQNAEWRVMPFSKGWTLVRLSWEMLKHSPDILFVPAHTLPLITAKKNVVMIHDIGYDHFPKLYKRTDILYHHFVVRWAKFRAQHILVPSEFTRQDLHHKYGISLNRITTVHHGFDAFGFHPPAQDEKSPINEPYFYFVGRMEYKKNISRMLHAFAAFKEQTGLPHKFLLAGRPAHGFDEIQSLHESLGKYKDDVQFLSYIDQVESENYLRHAQGLVFCSLFEGFGIPVLEAFASGTPVITSNTTSLPEVAGDAALLVNPNKVTEITKAMVEIATQPGLRDKLVKRGEKQIKHFSWEKAAQETLQVLERVAKGNL